MKNFYKIFFFLFSSFFFSLFSFSQINNPDIKRTYHWYFGEKAGLDFSSGSPVADTNSQMIVADNAVERINTAISLLLGIKGGDGNEKMSSCNSFFLWSPDSLPFSVLFTDYSTGSAANWFWDFGDSTYSYSQNPSHIYPAAGLYSVCLTITDSTGTCSSTFCDTIVVSGAWVSNFIYFPTATANTIKFCEVEINVYCDPPVITWFWDFGDGTTSNLRLPVHTYNSPGNYYVCLTVNDVDSICWQTCHTTHVSDIYANTSISICDGYWNDPLTWNDGKIPTSNDSVLIYNNVVLNESIAISYPGLLYIEENSSLCGHFGLTGEIITYGALNLDSITICGGYSDFIPINITTQITFGDCFGSEIYSMQGWPSTNSFTCISPDPCFTIIENKSDVTNILFYPNPNNGIFTVATDLTAPSQIILYNLLGKEIFRSKTSIQKTEINISSLPKGVYFVKIINDTFIQNKKIIYE